MTALSSTGRNGGYARRFEYRPEFRLFGSLIRKVIDATSVRERRVDDLQVVRLKDIFEEPTKEILVGFGQPNAYVTVGDGNGGVQKWAGKSLKRDVSKTVDTKGWVQSGIIVRLLNLPPHAQERLRESMAYYNGLQLKFWTCVNACFHVLERAGFTAADGKPLTDRYWPYAMMNMLTNGELLFEGQPVDFEVVRTTPFYTQRYSLKIIIAELMTIWRHLNRAFDGAAKKNSFVGLLHKIVHAPGKLLQRKSKQHVAAPVAPELPEDREYASDLHLSVSKASFMGILFRQIWGPHALFRISQDRVNIREFISEEQDLEPFPVVKNFVTRVKKTVLFSKPVIWLIRRTLCPSWEEVGVMSEVQLYDQIRTHSEASPNKYNLSITEEGITLSRINVGWKLIDWILSKHLVITGYRVRKNKQKSKKFGEPFCGECWKDEQGRIHLSPNSGTFQPKELHLDGAATYARRVFPNYEVVVETL